MARTRRKTQPSQKYNWKKLFFELIVVFLGVTAGFLLNNWQLERQDRQLETKYLQGFLQDVKANITELESSLTTDSLWLKKAKPLLAEIQAKSLTVDSANTLVKKIIIISKAEIQTGTYEDIINSGNLNIIRDYQLKKSIVEYHVALDNMRFVEDYFYRYFNDFVMPFVFSNVSVLTGEITQPEVIKTTRFANVVAGYFSMVQQRKSAYAQALDNSYNFRKQLEALNLKID